MLDLSDNLKPVQILNQFLVSLSKDKILKITQIDLTCISLIYNNFEDVFTSLHQFIELKIIMLDPHMRGYQEIFTALKK